MNEDIRTCKYCGKLFKYIGNKLCPDCVHHMHEAERQIRDYLYEHVGADVNEISEGTGLDERTVLHLLKEGILTASSGVGASGALLCDMCKKPIAAGKICNSCKTELGKTLNSVLPERAPGRTPNAAGRAKNKPDNKKGMHLEFR